MRASRWSQIVSCWNEAEEGSPVNSVAQNHKKRVARVVGIAVLWVVTVLPAQARAQEGSVTPGKLRVGTIDEPPAAMKSADGQWEGLSIELWHKVAQKLGVQYGLREYSSLEEMLDAFEQGKFDVMTAVAITNQREMIMDFSHPFLRSGSAIAVAAGSTAPRWLRIAENFLSWGFLKVIGLLILLWVIMGLMMWLFEHRHNPEMFGGGIVKGLEHGIWWAVVTMTTVGYGDKSPKTLGGRIVAVVWMLSAIIVFASFTAHVTTSLTVGELGGKVRGLRDLPSVRVGAVAESESLEFLIERGIAVRPFVHERDGLQAIVEKEIDAFVYNELVLKYLARTEFPHRVRVLAGTFDHYYVSMGIPQDSPLREPLNRALLEIMSGDDWPRLVERYVGSDH